MSAARPKAGLGRGLGELLQRTDPELATVGSELTIARFADLPVARILPNPKQPREAFDEDALTELSESIKEIGLLQPIVVRPIGDNSYELVMGERRLRAAKMAGFEVIPAIIRRTQDHELLRDALLENLQRQQLNPLEEAAAYQQMLADFGCTQEELATRIKRSRPQISNTIRLLLLPLPVQRRVAAGVLSAGHARALLTVDDPQTIEKLASKIISEGLSVRATEELVTLGVTPQRQKRSREKAAVAAELTQVAQDLSEALDTRVKVLGSAKRGRIVIEYAGADDLARLASVLNRT
ncbi:MAG: ParB/RepB/Spo0J family partition protein [Propionibacteriaceae bacterium]|nr:ParB/RepB/Spo0J family partition protein [Propionibacteriaceae bacterium]